MYLVNVFRNCEDFYQEHVHVLFIFLYMLNYSCWWIRYFARWRAVMLLKSDLGLCQNNLRKMQLDNVLQKSWQITNFGVCNFKTNRSRVLGNESHRLVLVYNCNKKLIIKCNRIIVLITIDLFSGGGINRCATLVKFVCCGRIISLCNLCPSFKNPHDWYFTQHLFCACLLTGQTYCNHEILLFVTVLNTVIICMWDCWNTFCIIFQTTVKLWCFKI